MIFQVIPSKPRRRIGTPRLCNYRKHKKRRKKRKKTQLEDRCACFIRNRRFEGATLNNWEMTASAK